MVQEGAGQASSVYIANISRKIDWAAILRRGANDAINGFIGGLLGGALTKQFSKLFGSYIKLSPAELEEFGKALGMKGPLPADYFMTAGQKFVVEFLSGAALAPVTAAITIAVNKVSGGEKGPENMAAFMEGVARDIAQGGLIQLFIAFLAHKLPAKSGSSSGGHGEAPSHPPVNEKPPVQEPAAAQKLPAAKEPPVALHPAESPAVGAPAAATKKGPVKEAASSGKKAAASHPAEAIPTSPVEPVAESKANVASEPPPAKAPESTKGKKQTKGQRDEAMRRQRRVDAEYGDQVAGADQHASKKKSRKLQRDEARQGARHDPQAAADQAGEKAMTMINDARSGKFTSLKDSNKRAMVLELERLMEQAGWSANKRNPLKGGFDEALRTPRGEKGQPEYLAGGPRLNDQGKTGTARPDYSRRSRGKRAAGGAMTPKNEHVNLKADNLQLKSEGEALSTARKYVKQAQKNAKALPIDAGVVLRYGSRPIDPLGQSAPVEAAMNLIHFTDDSPIVEVHYGTVAYRRPGS
jgi:hypothetical protein